MESGIRSGGMAERWNCFARFNRWSRDEGKSPEAPAW
jgi:hypothetical protein